MDSRATKLAGSILSHTTTSGEGRPLGAAPVATTIKATYSNIACIRLRADSQSVQRMECLARLGTHRSTQAEPFLRMHRIRAVAFHCMLTRGWQVMVGILPPLTSSATSQRHCNISEAARVKWRHVSWG